MEAGTRDWRRASHVVVEATGASAGAGAGRRGGRGRGRAERGHSQKDRRTEMDSQSNQQPRGCLSCSFEVAAPSARCICGV